jgi:hypothetical protein
VAIVLVVIATLFGWCSGAVAGAAPRVAAPTAPGRWGDPPPGTVRTVVGHPFTGRATDRPFEGSGGAVPDQSGNLYYIEEGRVLRVSAQSDELSTVAGIGDRGRFINGVTDAVNAPLSAMGEVAPRPDGSFYFLSGDGTLTWVDPAGKIHADESGATYGLLRSALTGDIYLYYFINNGTTNAYTHLSPTGTSTPISLDSFGSDQAAVFPAQDGTLSVLDWTTSKLYRDDNGTISLVRDVPAAPFSGGYTTSDAAGNLYVEAFNASGASNIFELPMSGSAWQVFAGTYQDGWNGDGHPATETEFHYIDDMHVGPDGGMYVLDSVNDRIREITPSGVVRTVIGNGSNSIHPPPDGSPASAMYLQSPRAIALDMAGNLLVANYAAATVTPGGLYYANANLSGVDTVYQVTRGPDGSLFVLSFVPEVGIHLDHYPVSGGPPTTLAPFTYEFGIRFDEATLVGLAIDRQNNAYISVAADHQVVRVDPSGVVTVVVGTGATGSDGDGGPATKATLTEPTGLAFDRAGNLYVADRGANNVRRVDPAGVITTAAGTGQYGGAGLDGPAVTAELARPTGLATDARGDLYIADSYNARVVRVSPNGAMTDVAGGGAFGDAGDGGPARHALFTNPVGLAVDDAGTELFIADSATDTVRRVALEDPYVAMSPVRLLDTRAGIGAPPAKVAAGATVALQVTGQAGIPDDASAVVLNVTATEAEGPGYLTVFPCGTSPPLASNLNYESGQTVPNLAVARVGAGGRVCIYSLVTTHVVADASGWYPAGHAYEPVTPFRIADTRVGFGAAAAGGKLPADGVLVVTPTQGVVGTDATAVVLNVTATEADGPGYLTVYPCDQPRPLASNVNYQAGQNVPNLVAAAVAADGTVCIFTLSPTHVVVDVNGWYPAASAYTPMAPLRVLDTRDGTGVDRSGKVPADSTVRLHLSGDGGPIPAAATAAVLNVTVTEPDGPGFVTVYPCGQPRPLASNLNYVAGQNVPNLVTAPIGADGDVCLYTMSETHLVADLSGWHPG